LGKIQRKEKEKAEAEKLDPGPRLMKPNAKKGKLVAILVES
jgi:hypothetical protein